MSDATGRYGDADRFEIGRVLSRMAAVLRRNFPVLAGLALLLSGLPSLLVAAGRLANLPLDAAAIGPLGLVFGWPFSLAVSVLLQAALIHGAVSDLSGRPVRLGDCLATAVRHLLPLIGIGFCVTIACFVGLFLFIVPGVILALALCVAAPVRVVENVGVFAAMSRSGDLTRNHRGAILLIFLLYVIAAAIIEAAIAAAIKPLAGSLTARLLLEPLFQAAGALVGSAGIASIYFELRSIKEGIGAEALAAAFD